MYRSIYMQCFYSAQDSFYISQKITLKLVYCQVLYGALTSLDRLGLFSAGRPLQSGQSEQHNVLPLTSCPSRFTLLPISTQPIRSSIQAPALQKSLYKAKASEGRSHTLTETAAAVLPQTSSMQKESSFYNKLGSMSSMSELSSWFSNIGSKSQAPFKLHASSAEWAIASIDKSLARLNTCRPQDKKLTVDSNQNFKYA